MICIKTTISMVFTGGVWQTGGGGEGEKKKTGGAGGAGGGGGEGEKKTGVGGVEKKRMGGGGGGETDMLLEVQSCLVIHYNTSFYLFIQKTWSRQHTYKTF